MTRDMSDIGLSLMPLSHVCPLSSQWHEPVRLIASPWRCQFLIFHYIYHKHHVMDILLDPLII
jgi:hypothetical protein